MARSPIAVGIDVGTTSTKVGVFGPRGKLLSVEATGYPLLQPRPGWAEQDPEAILAAVFDGVARALATAGVSGREVAVVGLGTAMHSLLAQDAEGRSLTPLLTWADQRAADQARRIRASAAGPGLYQRTGTPIHPMAPLAKLVWLREEHPELFARAARFISFKELLVQRLFGRVWVDHAIASATGLFAAETLDWDPEALAIAGVRRDQLGQPVPTTTVLTGLDTGLAARMGLPTDVPVVIGASDGVLANLGVGAVDPGVVAVTIGTSGAIRAVVPSPRTDPLARSFCYALAPGYWVVGGPTNAGGLTLRWLRDLLGQEAVAAGAAGEPGTDAYDRLIAEAAGVPPGADGLLMLPYLSGERAPIWNAQARGVYFGLALHHRREHLVRAALEGVVFGVGGVARVLAEVAGPLTEVRASGGFARSPLLRQMLADVLGVPVRVPESLQASALGGAALALHAVGELPDLASVRDWIALTGEHTPDPVAGAVYRDRQALFDRVYAALVPEFEAIARAQVGATAGPATRL